VNFMNGIGGNIYKPYGTYMDRYLRSAKPTRCEGQRGLVVEVADLECLCQGKQKIPYMGNCVTSKRFHTWVIFFFFLLWLGNVPQAILLILATPSCEF
jgi:hypothetical protein